MLGSEQDNTFCMSRNEIYELYANSNFGIGRLTAQQNNY
jgi:hypothetical protein